MLNAQRERERREDGKIDTRQRKEKHVQTAEEEEGVEETEKKV